MDPLMDKVAIIGYEMTRFGDLYELGIADIANIAIAGSMKSAGVERSDIDSLYVGNAGAGLFLGQDKAIEIVPSRIARVLGRIIRGLYFRELGRVLPSTFVVRTMLDQYGNRAETVFSRVTFPSVKQVGDGLFLYTYAAATDDADATIWLGAFYETVSFLGFVQPPTLHGTARLIRRGDR